MWCKPITKYQTGPVIVNIKPTSGSTMYWEWGIYFSVGTGDMCRVNGNPKEAKSRNRPILEENCVIETTNDLKLVWRLTFQKDNGPKCTVKATREQIGPENIFKCFSQVQTQIYENVCFCMSPEQLMG